MATRRPFENVRFELHDINTPVRWLENTVDFVHARDVSMAVSLPYNMLLFCLYLLGEAVCVLRPGGLFLSGEWEPFPVFNMFISRPAEVILC